MSEHVTTTEERHREWWICYGMGYQQAIKDAVQRVEALPYWQDEVLAPEVWVSRAAAIAAIKGGSDDDRT